MTVQDKLRQGSERAFSTVFHENYALLAAVAYGYVHDTAASEQIAEDALFTLWERREELLPLDSLRGWLMRTVRNRSIDYLRANPQGRLTDFETEQNRCFIADEDLFERLAGGEILDLVRSRIEALPTECRRVFRMSRYDGLSYNEIALRTGLSVNTVKYHIKNALATLRRELAPYLPEATILFLMINDK